MGCSSQLDERLLIILSCWLEMDSKVRRALGVKGEVVKVEGKDLGSSVLVCWWWCVCGRTK